MTGTAMVTVIEAAAIVTVAVVVIATVVSKGKERSDLSLPSR